MDEEEHEVYGADIPVADMDADADVDISRADDAAAAASKDQLQDLDEMRKRLKEMEEEAAALREMQAKVEKEMGAVQDPAAAASQASKEEVDSRSVFVGNAKMQILIYQHDGIAVGRVQCSKLNMLNLGHQRSNFFLAWHYMVDYACTPEEVQQHFQACGTVNRVTILTDKFGQPKGFAYVEFLEVEAVQEALQLNDTELHGRQIKVSAKRTNVPGMKQYRPRRGFNPYMGFPFRRPYMPPYLGSPYGYGKFPRFRRPMRYRPYF